MLREVAAEQAGESQFAIAKTTCEVPPRLLAPSCAEVFQPPPPRRGVERSSEMSDCSVVIGGKC